MQAKTIFILILAFHLTSCSAPETAEHDETETQVIPNPEYSQWQEQEHPPVTYELIHEYVFREDDDLLIGSPSYLVTDENENLYFYDFDQPRLISLTSEGELRWISGQEGSGPGDFESIRSITLHNNKLYISNVSGSRLDTYDLDGNYLESQAFPEDLSSASVIGITDENHLILSRTYWSNIGSMIAIADYSNSFEKQKAFPIQQLEGVELKMRGSIRTGISYFQENIVSGNFGEYLITFYNLEGNSVKKITRDFDRIVRPGITQQSVRSFGGVQAPYFFPDGHFAVRAAWPTNISDPDQYVRSEKKEKVIYRNTLDYFNPNGKLIYSFETDGNSSDMGYLTHIDQKGHAYFLNHYPVTSIRKYKVNFPNENN
ncbi:MAG: 6-bladed beta-propeller [Balneolaceae bacterium]|nr:6-bladed beta-propeller [Balneolaceae bacterium]